MLAIMDAGSINKAATRLRVSQPALTKSIQRLETELGVELFRREARGMRPTIYAERFSEFARATCVGFEQSITDLHALKTGASGTVTLCGPPIIAASLFPEVVVRVTRTFPGIAIRIVEQIDGLIDSLRDGKCDIVAATMTSQTAGQGLHRMSMFDDEFVVIARRGHALCRSDTATAADLANLGWVFSTPGNLHRRRLEQYFETQKVQLPVPVVETSSPSLIKAIVLQSDCVALMARMGVKAELENRSLHAVAIESPLMVRSIGLIWRSNHALPVAVSHVIEAIRSLCAERGHPIPEPSNEVTPTSECGSKDSRADGQSGTRSRGG